MAYSYQTFSVGEVLTAAKMQQVEVNIRDHVHGSAGVVTVPGSAVSDVVLLDGSRSMTGKLQINMAGPTITSSMYSQGHIEVRTTNNTAPTIGFHRDGYSAIALYESAGDIYTMNNAGVTGKMWHDGNYGRGALVYNTAGAAAGAAIPFASEVYDSDNIHDNVTNNTRLTVPSGFTKVRLSGQVLVTASSAAYAVRILKNGAAYIGHAYVTQRPSASSDTCQTMLASAPIFVNSGDYFTISTLGQAASAETTGNYTWFAMELLG